jgi:hypothetical protein
MIQIMKKLILGSTILLFACDIYDSQLLHEPGLTDSYSKHSDPVVDASDPATNTATIYSIASNGNGEFSSYYSDGGVVNPGAASDDNEVDASNSNSDVQDSSADSGKIQVYNDAGVVNDAGLNGQDSSYNQNTYNNSGGHNDGHHGNRDDYQDDSNNDGNPSQGDAGNISRFLYTPSNFDPTDSNINLAATGNVTLNCGESTFNSSTLAFGNWCGQIEPPVIIRTQSGGSSVAIIPFLNLTVASGSTFKLEGSIPVILAAYGNVTIEGAVDASASRGTPGPGGDDPKVTTDDCVSGTGVAGADKTSDNPEGSSGGGGGAFGDIGGKGGKGSDSDEAAAGGTSIGFASLIPLRGGCSGGRGGYGGLCRWAVVGPGTTRWVPAAIFPTMSPW